MDFKSFRTNKLKLSQAEMAELCGVDKEKIEQWDNNPQLIQLGDIEIIAQKTGIALSEILEYKKPQRAPFKPIDTWNEVGFRKQHLIEYVSDALKRMDVSEENRNKYIQGLEKGISNAFSKPSVAIVGRSDTGKSTLINALLGQEHMPVSWTPTTAVAVYIKHISDRPEFIHDNVWMFKEELGEEKNWNSERLYDEEYCNAWKVSGGDYEILSTYGTRQGSSNRGCGAAVAFVDSPLLLDCDIVDLPGYGTDDGKDDEITRIGMQSAEILIYLSLANAFMRIDDINFLKGHLRMLPVYERNNKNKLKILSNFFVVASQAHTVNNGNRGDLNSILNNGYQSFLRTLSDGYWKDREKLSGYSVMSTDVKKRFFTYTTDIPDLCDRFENAFKNTIELLPRVIDDNAREIIKEYVDKQIPSISNEIETFNKLLDDREKYVLLLDEINSDAPERASKNADDVKRIRGKIDELKRASIREFDEYYNKEINADSLRKMIVDKGVKKNEKEIQVFVSRLHDEILEKCGSIIKKQTTVLSKEISDYIDEFNNDIKKQFDQFMIPMDFDTSFVFAEIIAGIGIVGGLGAFVLANTGAALLLGGGAIAAGVGAVAPILGPVGVGLGALILLAIGLFRLFTGGWEGALSRKIIEIFDEKEVAKKYREAITGYWEETTIAFDTAVIELENKWTEYVDRLSKFVNENDPQLIQDQIDELKDIESFFVNIPL